MHFAVVVVIGAIDEELEARSTNEVEQRYFWQQHLAAELPAAVARLRAGGDEDTEAVLADDGQVDGVQQPAFAKTGVAGDDVVEHHDGVVAAVVAEHSPHAFDPFCAVGKAAATGLAVGVGRGEVGDRSDDVILVQMGDDAAGVVGVAALVPLLAVHRRGLHPPARADAALATVVGIVTRVADVEAGAGLDVIRVGDGDEVVGDALVGVVHVVVGAIRPPVEPTVDGECAALVDCERTLIEMAVRPVVVAGLEG